MGEDPHHRQIKVWADGCYDLVHFGHANSLRQAKACGDYLIVGVHSDQEIAKHKGPPIFSLEERCKMLRAMKWVDEVQENQPYITTIATLDKFNCDFCCHGDDITTTDEGVDTYQEIKTAGRYKQVPRTHGISTTSIVKRLLSLKSSDDKGNDEITSPWTGVAFLPTTKKIIEFSNNRSPQPEDTIIYCPGAFDLFHVGHLDFLEKLATAHSQPFIIIGLYSDQVISSYQGNNYPIMSLHERLLTILACKYVSEVVIGAPYFVTKDLMDHFNVTFVAHGKDISHYEEDPFRYPKEVNKYIEIDSLNSLTTEEIAERVLQNSLQFESRNKMKERKEIDYLENLKLEECN